MQYYRYDMTTKVGPTRSERAVRGEKSQVGRAVLRSMGGDRSESFNRFLIRLVSNLLLVAVSSRREEIEKQSSSIVVSILVGALSN